MYPSLWLAIIIFYFINYDNKFDICDSNIMIRFAEHTNKENNKTSLRDKSKLIIR